MKDKQILAIWIGISITQLIVIFAIGQHAKVINNHLQDLTYTYQTASLHAPDNYYKVRHAGVYFSKGYYCVWTKGRENQTSIIDPNLNTVQQTAIHESCHALVAADKEHFCK